MTETIAITWNPAPKSFINTEDNIGSLYNEHLRYLRFLKDIGELYPELSASGKLHYHGIVKIPEDPDLYTKYMRGIRSLKRKGFIKIKVIKPIGLDGWRKYCRKNATRTQKVFELYEVAIIPISYKPVRVPNLIKGSEVEYKLSHLDRHDIDHEYDPEFDPWKF